MCWSTAWNARTKNASAWFFGTRFWNFVGFSVILSHVPQGSVATYVGCGGMSAYHCIANSLLSLSLKEFLKSVKIWQSYCQSLGRLSFLEHVINVWTMDLYSSQWYSQGWLGGVVVSASDSRLRGPGFVSRPMHRQATTLGKLLTAMCLCHQAVQFGTGQRAVMLCGREGNHRSGVSLAIRHRL